MGKCKQLIMGIIISGLICGSITGVIAYSYAAKSISYTPTDNSWNVDNVKDAIDVLYTKSKEYKLDVTTTADASTILSGKTAYTSNGTLITGTLTKDCIKGTVKCTTCSTSGGQKIPEINFNPSRLIINSGSDFGAIHISEWNNNWVFFDANNTTSYANIGYDTYNYYFKYTSNGFYLTNWESYLNNKTYTYAACK